MAAHVRKQIREAVALAVTGLATTGANVFQSRVYPLQDAELPALRIFTIGETGEPSTIHSPPVRHRVTRLAVEAIAKATADLDDTLDQICKEVEIALATPPAAFNGTSITMALVATDIELTGTAEQPTGRATLGYEVDWYAAENAPDVAL